MLDVAELSKTVGADNVHNGQATLDGYSRDMSFVNPTRPACVVTPRNPKDIQALVRMARESRTPLVPISSGPPHFRGDTVPGTGGAIVVDLSGMKQVIHVDREARSVMFEPGVTFGELIPAVTKAGLRINMPLLPRKTKSVVGSLLEREPVTMPQYHWDIADPLNCVEIVFGTGDMFRTGAAAGPGTIEEQWAAGGAQVEAAGPSTASWYRIIQGAQGTMGIVTWASARCEILPKLERPFLVGSNDLTRIMEMVHWLVRLRLPNECFVLNGTNIATIMAKGNADDFAQMKHALPAWTLFYNVAGYDYLPEERVAGQAADAADVAQRVGLGPVTSLGGVSAFELSKRVQAAPRDFYWRQPGGGWTCQEIPFITNFQKVDDLTKVMYGIAGDAGYPASDIGVYVQPIVQGVNYHVEFDLFYNTHNLTAVTQVKKLSVEAVRELMAKGAFFSRPYGEATATIMNKDAATVAALKRVKSILDPDNIMNPGRLCF